MDINDFMKAIFNLGADFFTGVPDSLLRPFIDYIMRAYGVSEKHIVAANEGTAVGLAAGHYLATSKPAVVYMQNSGIGNAVNPICSLLHKKVYAIPVIFVIGWRGEPGIKDEPQHIFQGEATLPLLDCLEIPYFVISNETGLTNIIEQVQIFKKHIDGGQSVAFVIKNNVLQNDDKVIYKSDYTLTRENVIKIILRYSLPGDVFVCSTGKLSREVFELREQSNSGHASDFLTVGSMGHSIMIAQGIALAKPSRRVFCLDGDGAVLMHMGSLAVAGAQDLKNLIHIVINNGAHETVGGVPTVCSQINLSDIASKLGYRHTFCAISDDELYMLLDGLDYIDGPVFIEVMCNLISRENLGRPTITPAQNKSCFMSYLSKEIE